MTVTELGGGRLLMDLDFQGRKGIIGSYLLPEEEGWAMIEVGPATCHDALLAGLREAGIEPSRVRDVVVTHIHLDHAGGCGALAGPLPNATFHAHEAGVPHLVDPRRLVESARRAWGPVYDQLLGDVEPLPAGRIHSLRGGEELRLARGASLRVLATPGHARHHVALYDTAEKIVFTGDGAGVLVPGARHIRPALPPPDLDLPLVLQSLKAMAATGATRVAFSHFGAFDHAPERLQEAADAARRWTEIALAAARHSPSVASIAQALERAERELSRSEAEPSDPTSRSELVNGLEMAAMGLLRYFQRTGQLGEGSGSG